MAYSKPKTLAKSAKKSSFAAGCPEYKHGNFNCYSCEIAED